MSKAWTEALRRQANRAAGMLEPASWRRDRFVLYRIIGNDLPPRHEDGQSLTNLRFILEREPALEGCEKRWIVNRIVDPVRRAAIEALLNRHGQPHLTIPFEPGRYRAIGWDLERVPGEAAARRHEVAGKTMPERQYDRMLMRMYANKNAYVMNNNGARNAALADARRRGGTKWILPWDGNCFVTTEAWRALRTGLARRRWAKFVVVPMARIADNDHVLAPGFAPPAEDEPQIAFRCDAESLFNEAIPYGRRPKVELLMRLGVPGPWWNWVQDPWDDPHGPVSPEASRVVTTGWVARLAAGGVDGVDGSLLSIGERGRVRNRAIRTFLDGLDDVLLRREFDRARPLTIDPGRIAAQSGGDWQALRGALRTEADTVMARGPFSVMQKSGCAASGDPHDYFSAAPYYWPNPDKPDGLPYIARDGLRAPGTTLFEAGSEAYDRSALQRALTDPVVAALAFLADGDARAAAHGARLIRTWFVDPATRMNPHLSYAQVRRGHNGDVGYGRGLVETTDLVFLLDAARILEAAGALPACDAEALRDWCRAFRDWVVGSPQGLRELTARNNHGTAHDLQMLALAAYLGDGRGLIDVVRRAQSRLLEQFGADGSQPEEQGRTLSAGYHCFNLQLWVTLAQAAERCGLDVAHIAASDGRSLRAGLDRFFQACGAGWPHLQIAPFDEERLWPLRHARAAWYGAPAAPLKPLAQASPVFRLTVGIRPFWQFGGPYG